MRKLRLSQSFFTLDGEFLDGYVVMEIQSEFGNSEKVRDEILAEVELEGYELEIDTAQLDAFWTECRNAPTTVRELLLAETDYESSDQYETYKGRVRLYLDYRYEPEKKTKPKDEPQPEQLDLFQ